METSNEELLSLRDKANLALGFALLQAQRAAEARPILERVRLEGPFSSMALLGVGWADSVARANSSARWCRGWRCASAICSTRPCRSPISRCRTPTISSGASGQAAEYYNSAIESLRRRAEAHRRFDRADPQRQPARPAAERRQEGHAHLVLAAEDAARCARVALPVSAARQQRIPGGLKNYRELNFMSRNLDDWREDVSRIRQHARHPPARPTTSACRRPMR